MNLKASRVFILLGVLAMVLSGCEEDRHSGAAGKLRFHITATGAVTDVTTRSGEEDVPDVKDFSMEMLQDGKVQSAWDKLSDYDEDTTFPIGTYTLRAFYGDMDQEGFASPYYEGTTDVVISSGQTANVEATCKLANTKITIEYTDDFKSYFKTYSSIVQSDAGGSEITFKSDESRAAYVKPGRVTVKVSFTKATGGSTTEPVVAATIEEALPQHHYHLLMDVDAGKAMLSVIFDRVTEEKPVTLDISDKALNIKAPYFTLTGFEKTSNDNNQWDGNLTEADKLSALLTSLGGFTSCILKVNSPNISDWPLEGVNLADLSADHRALLDKYNFKLTGFGANKDQMAIIDFTGVVPHLNISDANSTHLFSLQAISTYGKQSEEYVLNLTTPKNFMLLPAEPVKMGSTTVVLPVKLKEGDPDNVELYYKNYGTWTRINQSNIQHDPITGKPGYYKFTATGVSMGFVAKEFIARYNGAESSVITVGVIVPNYTIKLTEGDVWAHEAVITIIPEDPEELLNIMKSIEAYYFQNGQWVKASREKGENQMVITELLAGTSYQFKTTCDDGGNYSNEVTGVTEIEMKIPNNNFADGWKSLFSGKIKKGGKYRRKFLGGRSFDYIDNFSVFDIDNIWVTTNKKTVPINLGDYSNTWYLNPSVKEESDRILINNVAWANDKKDPPEGTNTLSAESLSELATPNNLKYSAGKLFLGEYSYDHTNNSEFYIPGIEFTSRPKKLKGYYSYKAVGADKGKVVVIVENRTNGAPIVLAEGSQELVAGETEINVSLDYKNTKLKATHLRVLFTSSSVDDNDDKSVSDATIKPFVEDHKSEAVAYGSQLTIQKGITLEY